MSTKTDQANPEEVAAPVANETSGDEAAQVDASEAAAENSNGGTEGDVQVNTPDFQPLQHGSGVSSKPKDLNRFQEIKVSVSADLGRASVPLQTLLDLGEGSVLELDREIGSPVDLVAQGVTLASGEVVVVNGKFAIRVTEVYEGQAG